MNIKNCEENSDLIKSLSKTEKGLCTILTRMEIEGKGSKNVPVLLTKELKEAIDILVKFRNHVGVSEHNQFLFARRNGATLHYRGSECLRDFATECEAENPENLRSTKLRKHIATVCQILNLKDHELEALSKFMGHDLRIHKDYYRLPHNILETAKLSKIFLSLEKGDMMNNYGRSLDGIKVTIENDINEEDSQDLESRNVAEDFFKDSDRLEKSTLKKNRLKEIPTKDHKKNTHQVHQKWSEKEKRAVERHLLTYILEGNPPGKTAIEKCKAKEPSLAKRDWTKIKDYCRNRGRAIRKQNMS